MQLFVGILVFLIKKWKFLLFNVLLCVTLAYIYSFHIAKKQFLSSVTFLPINTSKSALSLAQFGLSDLENGSDVSLDQIKIIFGSTSFRRQIIEKFDYYRKFKLEKSPNPLKLALKMIDKDIVLETTEKGSLGLTEIQSFTIKCFHSSPDTAFMIAQFTFRQLDSILSKISSSKANETKVFINSQLTAAELVLDSLQLKLNIFQKENKAYEIPEQIRLTIKTYGDLKAQSLANDLRIKSLQNDMYSNSPELAALQKQNSLLRDKMRGIENSNASDVLIGFDKYSDLLPVFTNLLREIETRTRLVAFLTQQYEEAKIKENKVISNLIVIDKPLLPQYKERPKRVVLLVGIIFIYYSMLLLLLSILYIYRNYWTKTQFYNEFVKLLKS